MRLTPSGRLEYFYLTASAGIAKSFSINILLGRKLVRVSKLKYIYYPESFCSKTLFFRWGYKKYSLNRLKLFNKNRFIQLEDGFLRSYGPSDLFQPLSIVIDGINIYYNSSNQTYLEMLLSCEKTSLLKNYYKTNIRYLISSLIHLKISKYNQAPNLNNKIFQANINAKILVVDQTFGDMSVECGGASKESFADLLNAALTENSNATIYIKTHPEVTSGRKKGYLTHIKDSNRIVMIRDNVNPIDLIQKMDKVYVVTSQMGFEALLCGKPVVTFGVPWYAGWGLTDDRVKDSPAWKRRTKKRTVEELFYAAYIKYTCYLNPITHKRGNILNVIDWLIYQKKMNEQFFPGFEKGTNQGRMIGYGFRTWKAFNVKPLFSLYLDRVLFVKNTRQLNQLTLSQDDQVVCWGNQIPKDVKNIALKNKVSTLHLEDGFIRSVGLGSDLIRPLSLVFDKSGMYFDATKPSDLEHILNKNDFTNDELKEAKKLKRMMIQHQITKYNIDPDIKPQWKTSNKKVILVPGQVEDDASIRFGSFWIQSNLKLLEEVRIRNPKAYIVYKPHPDVVSGNRHGKVDEGDLLLFANKIENEASIIRCIEGANEIHTMTSLTGFDALIRGKKVVTYGEPFYAGWGLTEDLYQEGKSFKRRTEKLKLDELIAGTLIRYPVYWDWDLKGYTTCEATILRIIERKKELIDTHQFDKLRIGWMRRQLRKINTLRQAYLN
jgi:capsular polysaccharide export protein